MNRSSTTKKAAIPTLACATIAGMLILSGCGTSIREYRANGNSMLPLLASGDRIFVDVSDKARSNLHDGDVVVFRHKDSLIVKRILAMPGETISGDHGKVIRDGKQIDEPYLAPANADNHLATFPARTLGAGEIFVAGDKRDLSSDSRLTAYGPVYVSDVIGKYSWTYWHTK